MEKSDITKQIKAKAIELGFDLVGIAAAVPLKQEGDRLREWLERDLHGEMGWLERRTEMRADPGLLFPGAKSVVSLAINYYTPHKHPDDSDRGKISRYAWGDDYHVIVKDKLWELLIWLRDEFPGADGKVCVDTAPIMDKVWAVKAGLGWIGKHTNLITQELGSWVFLGELVTDLELDYETDLVEDHCGNCTACLDACPTDAIVEPYLVDSKLCLSYATIELRSADLPQTIINNQEGWLYGCDICQDVCPWNRFEEPTDELRFEPRTDNIAPRLETILALEHADYTEKFRKSAIKRTKLEGLKRNAAALMSKQPSNDGSENYDK